MSKRVRVRRSLITETNCANAVARLREDFVHPDLKGVVVFVSTDYELDELGPALKEAFSVPVVGCTSSGVIGSDGYTPVGISAAAFYGSELEFHVTGIDSLTHCHRDASFLGKQLAPLLGNRTDCSSFAFVLIDGLSMAEERFIAALSQHMPGVPLVGGSAADKLSFSSVFVLRNGAFRQNSALVVGLRGPFCCSVIRTHHFRPSEQILVVTSSIPERRIICELDGEPALRRYAELLGLRPESLQLSDYIRHPLLLKFGGTTHVRSIQCAVENDGLKLFCAIEDGLVLRLGEAQDPVSSLKASFDKLHSTLGEREVEAVLGFDCILRRIEFEELGIDKSIGEFYALSRVFGFSTYGEQIDCLHVNQTFTGVALASL